ncbi:hypothetical protein ES319_D01G168600v1 [Gossypium barbadense]|uniref:Uncharacterized protein n=1 Tax=Gossypium barbadense TaxID=3634 RepID=A0A5J5SQ20_GOSBA|nr:hypothetical protein ES319_D01G168600v1 [Gossypium barbadense]
MLDVYGNHVEEGLEVQFQLDGFSIPGLIGSKHKVDNLGRIDLGGLLKVTAGYGKQVSLSILHGDKVTFKQAFQMVFLGSYEYHQGDLFLDMILVFLVSCGSPCSMLFICCYWWFPVLQL